MPRIDPNLMENASMTPASSRRDRASPRRSRAARWGFRLAATLYAAWLIWLMILAIRQKMP
jgi:hypothetical protein